jgi:hypothetical protein
MGQAALTKREYGIIKFKNFFKIKGTNLKEEGLKALDDRG